MQSHRERLNSFLEKTIRCTYFCLLQGFDQNPLLLWIYSEKFNPSPIAIKIPSIKHISIDKSSYYKKKKLCYIQETYKIIDSLQFNIPFLYALKKQGNSSFIFLVIDIETCSEKKSVLVILQRHK